MRSILLAATGGIVGASARWSIGELIAVEPGTFPWNTLIANLVGCVLMGIATRMLRPATDAWFLIGVGALGGLTTFSSFAVETRGLVDADRPSMALLYVAVTVIVGITVVEVIREEDTVAVEPRPRRDGNDRGDTGQDWS